jgi:hypothetical protein
MSPKRKKLLIAGTTALIVVGVGAVVWRRQFYDYTPAEALLDLQAAVKVRKGPQPVERFMEARYGSMSEPANRQKAFLDFFNVGHIKGLNLLSSRMGDAQRQANTAAMAQWVANYRNSMSPDEKGALRAYLASESGRAGLQQATAVYLQQDVHFRVSSAPVIQELMTTLSTVKGP